MQARLERFLESLRAGMIRPLVRWVPAPVTPNALSWARLFLAVVLAWLLWSGMFPAALAVYLVAVATDALDGELARIRGHTTRFGARLDPAIDKVLHWVLFLAFFKEAPFLLGSLLLLDILLFLLGLLLVLHSSRTANLSASVWGKWKMILQVAGVLGLLVNAGAGQLLILPAVIAVVLGLALLCAVVSMGGYMRRIVTTRVPTQ